MLLSRRRGAIARSVLIAGCIGLATLVGPITTLADTDLDIGGEATVAYAQGDNVHIRTDASADAESRSTVPEGTTLTVLDGPFADGDGHVWYQVDVDGVTGYMVSDYLANSTGILRRSTGAATATDNVHLRSGPGLAYLAIDKIEAGDTVTVAGDPIDGWLRVTWNGTEGWAYGAFFTGAASDPAPAPEQAPPVDDAPKTDAPPIEEPAVEWIDAGTRYTIDSVNLRTEPALDSTVRRVLPAGVAVELTGETRNGFARGTANNDAGWVSLDYLRREAPPAPEVDQGLSDEPEATAPQEEPVASETDAEAVPEASRSKVTWPMQGGEWYIGQGYHGSSHQNRGSLWQYEYSFDLARTDENTAGETVYAPAGGTVRWLDPATGGISIDVGDGLAMALFHVDIDGSITEGDQLAQGQYLGAVSPPGGGGNGGWPHIHMTAWATDDGGNWSRQAIPFTGVAAIDGQGFPSDGSSQDWTGTVIYP